MRRMKWLIAATTTRWLMLAGLGTAVMLPVTVLSAQTVGLPEVSPKFVLENTAAQVTVVSRITGPVIPNSVLLLQTDAKGKSTDLGMMHDDGVSGDLKKGDGIFTIVVSLTVPPGSPVLLSVAAGFTGKLERIACGPAPLSPVKAFISNLTADG